MASLEVTVLVDNSALIDRYYLAEPGFSLYIEADGRKILFDAGYSDVFLRNARKMDINLRDLDYLVLSHGHLDHTRGLAHLVNSFTEARIEGQPYRAPLLIAHPYCFYPRPKSPVSDAGGFFSRDVIGRHMPVELTKEPRWLTENLVFLGEIERKCDFERKDPGKRRIVMPDGTVVPDHLLDDSALAYRSPEGLVIMTGCSHSGICNIVKKARTVCGEEKIRDIIGGFHLRNPGQEEMERTCTFLKEADPVEVHACHCTSLMARIALASAVPMRETGVGLRLRYR